MRDVLLVLPTSFHTWTGPGPEFMLMKSLQSLQKPCIELFIFSLNRAIELLKERRIWGCVQIAAGQTDLSPLNCYHMGAVKHVCSVISTVLFSLLCSP